MPLSYEIFMKHAEKICKNATEIQPARKVLHGVKHYPDGSAAVTDSHQLYLAKGIHDLRESPVITPAGNKVDDEYPDVMRLIPNQMGVFETGINVADMRQAADIISSVGSLADKKPLMKLLDDTASFDHYEMVIRYTFPGLSFPEPTWVNAKYMLDAMNLFKAAGCERVEFIFYGRMRPIIINNYDKTLLALILPVRKY